MEKPTKRTAGSVAPEGYRPLQLLTAKQAAKLLAISTEQLSSLAVHGDISYINVSVGAKREIRRYRESDVRAFIEDRKRTGKVAYSIRPALEILDVDIAKAAKIVARERKRKQRDAERAILNEEHRLKREAYDAWIKKCEEEAFRIRERKFLESLKPKQRKKQKLRAGSA